MSFFTGIFTRQKGVKMAEGVAHP